MAPFAGVAVRRLQEPAPAGEAGAQPEGDIMLLRILTMHVDSAKVDDWMHFTRDQGFPGMLAQPGCRQIWRLRAHGAPDAGTADFQVMTLWDSLADLERFRASPAMQVLSDAAAPLMAAPAQEQLFDVIADPPR